MIDEWRNFVTEKRIERGLLYEDFCIGQQFDHHWGRTLAESDAVLFGNLFMNYNPIYFNRRYAQHLGFKDIIVAPMFVFATALGLSVEDLSEAGGPFLGIDDLIFHKPAYVGDTIYSSSVVTTMRETKSRPGWGIVEWHTKARTEDGAALLEFRRSNLSRKRGEVAQ